MLSDETLEILGCLSTIEEIREALANTERKGATFELAYLEPEAKMTAKDRFSKYDSETHTRKLAKL